MQTCIGRGPSCRRDQGNDDNDMKQRYYNKPEKRQRNLKPRASMDPSEAFESLAVT